MIRRNLRYSDSRSKGVAYSALEPKLFSKLLFRHDGHPYLPGTTVRRRRLDWAEDHWCALGVTSELTKGLMETPEARSHGVNTFASEALPQIGQRVFLWVRATPLFLCRLHARRHRSYSEWIEAGIVLARISAISRRRHQ